METTEQIKDKANDVKDDVKDKVKNFNPEHKEGPVAAAIEDYTARIPSDIFLWASLGSMAASATLKILGRDRDALFVGQWAPSFLMLGLYNKLVKMEGYGKDK
ncbi:hypothetical protein [Persicitalea jodogahamensis]|uniref:Uncharacterized protein n=1 Tax=Persicitalea jodogahamensis TaxID=402147 RepID=A0A8J3D686_9BACT|nr:hypothetical protein [Persicitalea jodogahamensis]GHB80759.1 hypothetical protein GCM10007390_39100 [Persicitalea jodogahamensis]